ncbi:molybdopterin-binding protein [Alphaproteobacteria bacterium KMM 3653]|uniref:Molybdopterin-binding protein n=1 Tax=Harenicola maris TaxID=2841044 RepID=A0AAP2G2T6_9RHOB|nr:molybdopterin-binding protein [Harenicola maris]
MKFGPVPLAQAGGGILAHSLSLPGGRLRKGRVLGAADLAALGAAGIAQVVIARLEDGDMGEDAAALRLAQALTAGGPLRLGAAATGRVNIFADAPGVARVDPARITAANRVDPVISIATVPEWQRMEAGGMVGTVKIIAYGVAAARVEAAARAGQGGLSLCPLVRRRGVLIETELPGQAASDKGASVMAARMARLGGEMLGHVRVPHTQGAVAAALGEVEADVVFILTASATSDIGDVAPAALVQAGGRVETFGMPVDPGNLLFLGELSDVPVIGLPGCARSPALNGADWVMERVLCGVPVTQVDIMGMGVGGLLKEIPNRPQPRRG